MSLNQNFAGSAPTGRRRLDGTDRGLDALVGAVILVAELLIGFLAVYALYLFGQDAATAPAANRDNLQGGFVIALVGGSIAVGLTTLLYLVRLATARRSWTAPLWGLVLVSVACVVGYFIMLS